MNLDKIISSHKYKVFKWKYSDFRDDVETYDYIKEEIGFRLSDRLFDIKKEFEHGVDIGGGRGFLSRHILAETVKNLKVYDISETMLEQVYGTPGVNIERHLMTKEIIDVSRADDISSKGVMKLKRITC